MEADCRRIAQEADAQLRNDVLPYWFPRCIDEENGGYHHRFKADWSAPAYATKTSVHQSRMAWVCAAMSVYDPKLKDQYGKWARHGVKFMDSALRDREAGGVLHQVNPDGTFDEKLGTEKHLIATMFAIYGGATVYGMTRDERALALAVDTFKWLDEHAHDDEHSGYFEAFTREGQPILEPTEVDGRLKKSDRIGTPYGQKTMNSHIHVLEGLTELYTVWKDAHLRERLEEVLTVMRDKMTLEPGYLTYYYTRDWQALPGVTGWNSFGHDVEAAMLMLRAAEALGMPDDPKTLQVTRKIVDYALEHGWDEELGGFGNKKTAAMARENMPKVCWAQAEGLNVLLCMHERYGPETDRYWLAFVKLWDFLNAHVVDKEHGGWYTHLNRDGTGAPGDKSEFWHCTRALTRTAKRLNAMADHVEGGD